MIKLHLGCGKNYMKDYINIDIISNIADIKIDINDLSLYETESVDEIYASHVLEHFKLIQLPVLLKEWNRVLKKNGLLRIAVPDFDSCVKYYTETNKLDDILGLLYGGQKNEYDLHYVIYNFDILSKLLNGFGFNNIVRYDSELFLKDNDDYSKSYLPHLNKNGKLMSLNIICNKYTNDINLNDTILTRKKHSSV